ncbi:MAG: methylamine utilization protein MauJ [Victivallales bacterium]
MKWVDLAVKPNFSWPKVQVDIPFEGRRVALQPLTDKLSCTVSVFDDAGLTLDEGGTVLSRFLSRLAWSMNGGVVELFFCGSNNPARPGLLGRGNYETSCWAAVEPHDYLFLPSASNVNADLALGLFREGLSVNSVPFAFLSYFKVLNIAFPAGQPQKDWINANLAKIWYQPAVDRIHELNKSESDLGAYLYHQGRCAVAHANGTPLVNPDRYGDKRRLELDLPLMKEIAALFIEQEFHVLSKDAFWKYLRDTNVKSPDLLKKTVTADGKIVYAPVT